MDNPGLGIALLPKILAGDVEAAKRSIAALETSVATACKTSSKQNTIQEKTNSTRTAKKSAASRARKRPDADTVLAEQAAAR